MFSSAQYGIRIVPIAVETLRGPGDEKLAFSAFGTAHRGYSS